MGETGLKAITPQEASVRLARQLAQRITSEGLDPLAYSRDFELLWIEADYAPEIQEVGSLDDEKNVAQYVGQTEAELREYAQKVLVALINTGRPES